MLLIILDDDAKLELEHLFLKRKKQKLFAKTIKEVLIYSLGITEYYSGHNHLSIFLALKPFSELFIYVSI